MSLMLLMDCPTGALAGWLAPRPAFFHWLSGSAARIQRWKAGETDRQSTDGTTDTGNTVECLRYTEAKVV